MIALALLFALVVLGIPSAPSSPLSASAERLAHRRPRLDSARDGGTVDRVVAAGSERGHRGENEGSNGHGDHCLMQVNRRPDLASDPEACVRFALDMLRTSMRVCRAFPIAIYASGPGACTNVRAQRISRDRMALAARLVRELAAAEVVKPATTGFRLRLDATPRRWDLDPRDLRALNAWGLS